MEPKWKPVVEKGTFFNIFLHDESLKLTVECRPHQLYLPDSSGNAPKM